MKLHTDQYHSPPIEGPTYVCSVVMASNSRCFAAFASMFLRRKPLSLGPSLAKIGGSGMPEGNWEEVLSLEDIKILRIGLGGVAGVAGCQPQLYAVCINNIRMT